MNLGILSAVGVGFVLGVRHAFEPDHLAAITTLAARDRGWQHALRLGVAWGVGHTLSVAAVAIALIVVGVHVPASFYRTAELVVAVLLILLGGSSLVAEARRHRATLGPSHADAHLAGAPHSHDLRAATLARSLGFGVAHGMAGSGAVIVLLVAAASTGAGQMGYLAAFGMGTVVGMSMVSVMATTISGMAAGRGLQLAQHLRVGSALASAAIGVLLGWRVVLG